MLIRLIVPGEIARVEDLNTSLEAVLARHGIDAGARADVRLIVEELASNAIEYGGGAEVGQHELSVDIGMDDGLLTLRFRVLRRLPPVVGRPAIDVEILRLRRRSAADHHLRLAISACDGAVGDTSALLPVRLVERVHRALIAADSPQTDVATLYERAAVDHVLLLRWWQVHPALREPTQTFGCHAAGLDACGGVYRNCGRCG